MRTQINKLLKIYIKRIDKDYLISDEKKLVKTYLKEFVKDMRNDMQLLEYDICSLLQAECITISRAREILGIKYLGDMKNMYEVYARNKKRRIK